MGSSHEGEGGSGIHLSWPRDVSHGALYYRASAQPVVSESGKHEFAPGMVDVSD